VGYFRAFSPIPTLKTAKITHSKKKTNISQETLQEEKNKGNLLPL